MSKQETKHVLIKATTHRKALAAAGELQCTLSDYADAATAYFAERGLDPRSTRTREGVQIIDEIRKLGDRLFSFLQVQETGLLLPMARIMLDALNHSSSARRMALRLLLHQNQQQQTFEKQNEEVEKILAEKSNEGMQLLLKTLEEASKSSRRKKGITGQ